MKAVVLLSGGLDSTVLLAAVRKMHPAHDVVALNLFYGQKHFKEIQCAQFQAQKYGVRLIDADMREVFTFSSNPLLLGSEEPIPTASYAEQQAKDGLVKTYVPFRNGLFLSYATAIAIQLEAEALYYGAHADDAAGAAYPDCTIAFIEAMHKAIFWGSGEKIILVAPFKKMTKAEIVKLGHELNVDFAHTWSCYAGGEKACGICATCVDRLNAFRLNYLVDPVTPFIS